MTLNAADATQDCVVVPLVVVSTLPPSVSTSRGGITNY